MVDGLNPGVSVICLADDHPGEGSLEKLLLVPDISTSRVVVIFESSKDDLTLHLILKTTTALEVKTSVTNNSLSKDYLHLDDHTKKIKVIMLIIQEIE